MTKFTKKEILTIAIASLCGVVGILFCALPQTMYNVLELVICWVLIIYGALSVFIYCLTPVIFESPIRRFSALLSLILGLMIMLINSFLVVAVACLMVLIGIIKIVINLKQKDNQTAQTKADLIVGIVFCVLGLTVGILCYTQIGSKLLMIISGTILIFESVANILLTIYKNKAKIESK